MDCEIFKGGFDEDTDSDELAVLATTLEGASLFTRDVAEIFAERAFATEDAVDGDDAEILAGCRSAVLLLVRGGCLEVLLPAGLSVDPPRPDLVEAPRGWRVDTPSFCPTNSFAN